MNILILGGTADGRKLTTLLHEQQPNLNLIYSVAGLVRKPQVPATVISGGFSQFGGMPAYCKQQHIDAIIDVTHPYAINIGASARQTAHDLQLGHWRFLRPAWHPQEEDDWQHFSQRQELIQALTSYERVLLTLGQVSNAELQQLSQVKQIYLRTAVQPNFALPANVHWIKAIGPFDLEHELALLKDKHIQVMASKNSGGDATNAKLLACRELSIPIYMLDRPSQCQDEACHQSADMNEILSQVITWQQTRK